MDDAHDPGFLEALERGIELFNQQQFFEAYEVWAERWSSESGDGSDLLQGLVQIAVGFAKLQGGEARGTLKLLDSGATKLAIYSPRAYDVDVDALLELVRAWRAVAAEIVEKGSAAGVTLPAASLKKG
jgi:predicted metal-dependent hydrolase